MIAMGEPSDDYIGPINRVAVTDYLEAQHL